MSLDIKFRLQMESMLDLSVLVLLLCWVGPGIYRHGKYQMDYLVFWGESPPLLPVELWPIVGENGSGISPPMEKLFLMVVNFFTVELKIGKSSVHHVKRSITTSIVKWRCSR